MSAMGVIKAAMAEDDTPTEAWEWAELAGKRRGAGEDLIQTLEEVRDALMQPHPISSHGRVKAVLERRFGPDWLNGGQR